MNASSLLFSLIGIFAVLLSAAPVQAHKGLLSEGSHPPVFSLSDKSGKSVSLRAFLGPRRIVLLFNPRQHDLDTIQAQRAPFADRDLTVLVIAPPDSPLTAAPGPIHLLTDTHGKVAQEYGVADGRPIFYLIGKDGHIAVARHDFPTPRALFAIIDAMPMRRQEMRERGR